MTAQKSTATRQLLDHGYLVLDNFSTRNAEDFNSCGLYRRLKEESLHLLEREPSRFAHGMVSGSPAKDTSAAASASAVEALHLRGDKVLSFGADQALPPSLALVLELIDVLLEELKGGIPELGECERWSSCSVTCFPATGARYVRHIDNPDGNNRRRLTCLYYLNEDWTEARGGELRLFPNSLQEQYQDTSSLSASNDCLAGINRVNGQLACPMSHPLQQTRVEDCACDQCSSDLPDGTRCMSCMSCGYDVCMHCHQRAAMEKFVDVAPIADRLVAFWSDRRTPHEVLPTTGDAPRWAASVWYLDRPR